MSHETLHVLEPGSLICGKYRIEVEIGRGGMGVVYRALHIGLERPVALKVVLPELAHSEVVVRRMLDEARCAAQITSPHVVRVMDVGQLSTGQPFIVMELVEGEDLARVTERDGIPTLERAVQWVLEACVAIAEAHAKGIVHRDLKPENIFLAQSDGAEPQIKVLDFGISKRIDRAERRSVTRPNEIIGSPHYMAPEQIRAPLSVDARADIWSLGTILIELTTGHQAFGGDTLASVCSRVLESEPDLGEQALAALPPELVRVMRRAVGKDPGERFQSVAELAAALAPFAPASAAPALNAIARRSRHALAERSLPRSDCNVALTTLRSTPRTRARRAAAAVAALAGALVLCVNVWLIARAAAGPDARETPVAAPAAAASAPPPPTAPTPAFDANESPLEALPEPVLSPVLDAEQTEPSSPSSRVPPRQAAASPATSPRRTVESAPAVRLPASAPQPPAAPHNPWDLETFGGRR